MIFIFAEILSLPGPVICLAGFDTQLLVAVHDGVGVSGDQKMTMYHYRQLGAKPYAFRTTRYPVALSPKASLEWLGVSFEGVWVRRRLGGGQLRQFLALVILILLMQLLCDVVIVLFLLAHRRESDYGRFRRRRETDKKAVS